MQKVAVIGYVPPTSIPYYAGFLANLRRFKTKNPLILFSDYDHDWPGIIKVGDVEQFRDKKVAMAGSQWANPWSLNNALFFTGLRIARASGYSHIIYTEADARVGRDDWDQVIFDEFFSRGGYSQCCGGTMVIYGPCNHTMQATEKWRSVIAKNERRNFPIATYGAGGAAEKATPCVLVNGALGVYSMDWMLQLFDLSNTLAIAREATAWDFEIGKRLWQKCGIEAYDKVIHLDSIYSGYGDVVTSEADRMRMLCNGRVVGVHQIKSLWAGPERTETDATVEITPKEFEAVESDAVPAVIEEPATNKDRRVEIFIVTFGRDAEWTRYCLESIKKFCRGFFGVTVLVPARDRILFPKKFKGVKFKTFDEVPGKGFNDHQAQICMADFWCPEATHICHVDSDCLFVKPTTPDDYFHEWKPVMVRESFERIRASGDQPGRLLWKEATENALGFTVNNETMCRHPAVHWFSIYKKARDRVESVHGMNFRDYVLAQKNDFPQGFCEFVTLGAMAEKEIPEAYHWIEKGVENTPEDHLKQFWSYVGISAETKKELETILA